MSVLRRALGLVGWAALSAVALLGVASATVALLAVLPATRPAVAAAIVRIADEAIAGRLVLASVEVLPRGGVEIRGLEVYDPEERLVLSVGRAAIFADVTAIAARTVGLTVELDAPAILLEEDPDGTPSLARAFAPAGGGEAAPARADERAAGPAWTVHVSRFTVRKGEVWWVDARRATRLEAEALDLDARGHVGPDRAAIEARISAAVADPVAAPFLLELRAASTGNALRVDVLRASLGGTALDAVAEGDLARRSGRVSVTRLGIDRSQVRAVAPGAPPGDDLRAIAYAESDGRTATAALRVAAASGSPGRVDASVAARLDDPSAAAGFDVAVDRLDPSRLVSWAPGGSVSLSAHGAVAGSSAAELRGRINASVKPSRVRRGSVEGLELRARADRGAWIVERISGAAPGIALEGSLRWRKGGDVAGRILVESASLGAAVANLGALLGEPLPRAAGQLRLEGTLAGTEAAPSLSFALEAPRAEWGTTALSGVRLAGEVSGPAGAPGGKVEGRVAAVRSDGSEVATAISLSGSLVGDEAALHATLSLPGLQEVETLEARGRLGDRRETFRLSELSFGYPGTRWTLEAPATVVLAGPTVDRLALEAGAQRLVLAGGVRERGRLDARIDLERIDLARLPAGIVPEEERVRGELSATVLLAGTVERPEIEASLGWEKGAWRDLQDLSFTGAAAWDGAARRGTATLAAALAGGTIDLRLDAPYPLEGRPKEPLRASARVAGLRAGDVLAAVEGELAAEGVLSVEASLDGTVGAPTFRGKARLHDATIEEIESLALELEAEEPGRTLRVAAGASLDGRPFLTASAEVPLDLAEVLARPGEAADALLAAPLVASATLAGLDLSALEGRLGLPEGLQGLLDGDAAIEGTLAAPRGEASLELRRGAVAGYRELGARAKLALGAREVVVSGRAEIAGNEALRFEASLGAPVERLDGLARIQAAPLRALAEIPRLALARVSGEIPLAGTLEGKLEAKGTPGAPAASLVLAGEGISIEGRRLGDLRLDARYESARLQAEALFRSATGGDLRATLGLEADLGLGAEGPPLDEARAEASLVAEGLDLGFLPALAPGVVRAGAGKLSADVRAAGPLARMIPRGTLRLKEGRLSVSEFGDWTGIEAEAKVTDDGVEVPRIEVRRGKGSLTASGSLRGLASGRGTLEARLKTEALTITRAGSDFATFDLEVEAAGKQEGKVLSLEARVPRGLVRLPRKTPRVLQTFERREDVVVGRRELRRRRASPAAAVAGPPEEPYRLAARLVVPRGFLVKGIDPEVDAELKADVKVEIVKGIGYAEGIVEIVRGEFEPIGGRKFVVERGRVQFTGATPEQALLDFQARYDNPSAVVTVTVQGPALEPEIRLASQPHMDEGQIAMLIATGRTELKRGSGGVGTLTGEEAGKAALGAFATQAFKNLVADKLPLDTVALDASAIRAGKYVTDEIYVSYVRNFEADPEKGENVDEVRVEYQITPRWTFESRYGAQAGSASLVWSKDY